MTNLAPAPSRFTNRRTLSPGAMSAAIAVHLGVAAVIIALPQDLVPTSIVPIFRTHNIPVPPAPQPETTPTPQPSHKSEARIKSDPLPTASDPLFTTNGPVIDAQPAIIDPPLPRATPADPPPLPHIAVKVGARPDPRFAETFQPAYPPTMLRRGLEGSCTVHVAIDNGGRVIGVTAMSGTDPAFCEATERQARTKWRFRPATEDGVAVPSERSMTVQFRMTD